jgi:hypothetical protein
MERHRLEPQHRRLQHLKPAGAKRASSRLIVRVRARDENGHASDLHKQVHVETS